MLSRISAFLRVWVKTWVPIADLRRLSRAAFFILTILIASVAVLVLWCASMALLLSSRRRPTRAIRQAPASDAPRAVARDACRRSSDQLLQRKARAGRQGSRQSPSFGLAAQQPGYRALSSIKLPAGAERPCGGASRAYSEFRFARRPWGWGAAGRAGGFVIAAAVHQPPRSDVRHCAACRRVL